MKHYLESAERVLSEVQSTENGLTSAEAAARLARDGKNQLAEGKKTTLAQRFLEQIKDPMIIILLVAAVFVFLLLRNRRRY